MRVLITGACGFLARVLMRHLEASPAGHELVLMDRIDPQQATVVIPGGSERAHQPLESPWPFVLGEITDPEAVRRAVQGVDAIIHLAAAVTGLREHGLETMQSNVIGTFVMLDEARKAGVQRFLCASSVNAFGTIYWRISGKPVNYTKMPLDESFPPEPEDPYSLSKWFNEETCAAFHRAYGITTAAFRFAGVYNEELYQKTLAERQPVTAWSDDLYQWVHVEDVAAGLRQALEEPNLPGHGVYTLSAGDTRCAEPTMEILESFRPDLLATLEKPLEGRAPLMSIECAQQTFGYNPQYRLGE